MMKARPLILELDRETPGCSGETMKNATQGTGAEVGTTMDFTSTSFA